MIKTAHVEYKTQLNYTVPKITTFLCCIFKDYFPANIFDWKLNEQDCISSNF